ncbi:MAG: adenosylcobinamide-GDP ribazoletransferase [Nitrospiraceae bacterium]|nr:adenosylcobinamide-GDP ribazoletransferase [Nitrospiraceae bacterium]
MFEGFFAALGFLTIIPPPANKASGAFGRAPGYFPVIGILEGALFAVIAVTARAIGPLAAAGFIIAAHTVITGGLHLDGLSDTFDSLAVRGSAERKLGVMKSGTAGPIGAASVTLALILKTALLAKALSPGPGYFPFPAAAFFLPVASRWGMVFTILHGKPAKQEGLGAMVCANTDKSGAVKATMFAAAAIALWILLFKNGWFLPVSFAAVYVFSIVSDVFCKKSFGGITGDTIGATSELSEIIFLIPACTGYFS